MNKPVMPELPEPVGAMARIAWGPPPDYYTADQMHAYARTYAAALESRLREVEGLAGKWTVRSVTTSDISPDAQHTFRQCADELTATLEQSNG